MHKNNIPLKVALGYSAIAIIMILAISLVYSNTKSINAINEASREYIQKRGAADSTISSLLKEEQRNLKQLSDVMAGATVSTGATDDTLAILLLANTLLTETITMAAIAAKTNFFIIFCFFIVNIIFITFFVNSLACVTAHWRVHFLISQSACQKIKELSNSLIISSKCFLCQNSTLWKLWN